MFRRIAQNGASALVSIVLSLSVLEVVLRWSGRFPIVGLHSVSALDYDRIPGLWEPGQDFVNLLKPALAHHIRTNSLGLRGPEATLEPTRPRVLCIGDSFTFGDFVNDEETLPAQLGDRLEGAAEVLNGGVGGTTIVDQREYMKRYLVLQPDVVLLVFFENDLNDLQTDTPMHVHFARNRKLKGTLGPVYQRIRDTATFNGLLSLQAMLRVRRAAPSPVAGTEGGADTPPPWLPSAVERYATEAAELGQMLEPRDIELIVAAFPHPYVVSGEYRRDFIGPVSRALAKRQIQVVDLTPALRNSHLSLNELFFFPHDGHASPRAYAIAAEVLEPQVRHVLAARQQRAETEAAARHSSAQKRG